MRNTKPFSQSAFDRADPFARSVVKRFFQSIGLPCIDGTTYGVDLFIPGAEQWLELERRGIWKDEEFPYDTVTIPARKDKWFELENFSYVVVNWDGSQIGIAHMSRMRPHLEHAFPKWTNSIKGEEYFYHVPKTAFVWIRL